MIAIFAMDHRPQSIKVFLLMQIRSHLVMIVLDGRLLKFVQIVIFFIKTMLFL